jgi:hypothetical protein
MSYDHIDVELRQFPCEFGEAVVSALCPPIVDDNVPALFVAELEQARLQGVDLASVLRVREHAEKADSVGPPRSLCPRRERPCDRRAAEQCDDLASPHGIDPGELRWIWKYYQTSPQKCVTKVTLLPEQLVGCGNEADGWIRGTILV